MTKRGNTLHASLHHISRHSKKYLTDMNMLFQRMNPHLLFIYGLILLLWPPLGITASVCRILKETSRVFDTLEDIVEHTVLNLHDVKKNLRFWQSRGEVLSTLLNILYILNFEFPFKKKLFLLLYQTHGRLGFFPEMLLIKSIIFHCLGNRCTENILYGF